MIRNANSEPTVQIDNFMQIHIAMLRHFLFGLGVISVFIRSSREQLKRTLEKAQNTN